MKNKWIDMKDWQACAFHVDAKTLVGKPCYLGMDLSAPHDIAALALCFPPQSSKERYQFLFRFFMPLQIIMDRVEKDDIPYSSWIKKNIVINTPGDTIDYPYIMKKILEDAKSYEIREIAYDPWKAHEIIDRLEDKGLTMIHIQQTFSGMCSPTNIFRKEIQNRAIAHDGNPVMNWMISCAELKSDRQGNIMPKKPNREKSEERIEGVMASIMALARAVRSVGK